MKDSKLHDEYLKTTTPEEWEEGRKAWAATQAELRRLDRARQEAGLNSLEELWDQSLSK